MLLVISVKIYSQIFTSLSSWCNQKTRNFRCDKFSVWGKYKLPSGSTDNMEFIQIDAAVICARVFCNESMATNWNVFQRKLRNGRVRFRPSEKRKESVNNLMLLSLTSRPKERTVVIETPAGTPAKTLILSMFPLLRANAPEKSTLSTVLWMQSCQSAILISW